MNKIVLPNYVEQIINTLNQAGFEAYAVGGCIRDSLMGTSPKDFDVTTNAKTENIKDLFEKSFDTGIKYGTVSVKVQNNFCEITTFRKDNEYEDNRHPNEVIFTYSLLEDLKRRDFTINALAYNEKSGLIDYFSGVKDLENKVIRTVGNSNERFTEDALRIMRAFRFCAVLGFEIEDNTKKAAFECASLLNNISAERIKIEFDLILSSDNPNIVKELVELDILSRFSPNKTVNFPNLNAIPNKLSRLLTLQYYFFGDDEQNIRNSLNSLKYEKKVLKILSYFLKSMEEEPSNEIEIRKALAYYGKDALTASFYAKKCLKNQEYAKKLKITEKIIKRGDCISKRNLAINGDDLISLGFKDKEIGKIINQLYILVLDNPKLNKKTTLKNIALKKP